MKRRGFIGSAAAALAGAFVIKNPVVTSNGLVVPATTLPTAEVAKEALRLIEPEEPKNPIVVSSVEAIPEAACFVGYLDQFNLNVSRDTYEVNRLGSPYKEFIGGPVSAEVNMQLTGDSFTSWRPFSEAMNNGEEIEVYVVRRPRVKQAFARPVAPSHKYFARPNLSLQNAAGTVCFDPEQIRKALW